MLEFTRETELSELRKRQEAIEQLVQGMTPEQKATIARHGIRLTKRKNELKVHEDCTDGEHCESFEQINETQLLDYLRQGWVIVHKLGNGDVVIKNGQVPL